MGSSASRREARVQRRLRAVVEKEVCVGAARPCPCAPGAVVTWACGRWIGSMWAAPMR